MCIAVFHTGIVNDECGRTKISICPDIDRLFFRADIVRCLVVGFYGQVVLIGKQMCCSNSCNVIGLPVAFGSKIAITNPSVCNKFLDIILGRRSLLGCWISLIRKTYFIRNVLTGCLDEVTQKDKGENYKVCSFHEKYLKK